MYAFPKPVSFTSSAICTSMCEAEKLGREVCGGTWD